nr:unnamed protein product [Callosobruchus analis]
MGNYITCDTVGRAKVKIDDSSGYTTPIRSLRTDLRTRMAELLRAPMYASARLLKTKMVKKMTHISASLSYNNWLRGNTIDTLLKSEIDSKITFWRDVLHRIINVIITLVSCNLPLRSHDSDSGNFMAISPPFLTIILDTTQGLSKIDQLSVVFRYISVTENDDNVPKEIKICESFLGFIAVTDCSAAEYGIDLTKCRGQGYDGANVMSGVYGGLQTLIKEHAPNADYVHCAAHALNLVLNDAARHKKYILFFGNSIKCWAMLSDDSSEKYLITIKKVCPTRWSSRNDALLAVKKNFLLIMKTLYQLNLISNKKDEREECKSIINILESFDFLVLVTFFLHYLKLLILFLQLYSMKIMTYRNLVSQILSE